MAFKEILRTALLCVILQQTGYSEANGSSNNRVDDPRTDPANFYTTVELVCSEGYPVQEHRIVTKDGYVLTMHRIPNGRTRQKIPKKKNHYRKIHLYHHPDFDGCVKESLNITATGVPILFVPALLMADDGWLLQGPGNDLAYILADLGYDIWLLNFRGTVYSKKHVTLSPSEPRFWDYSFHELATIDTPAAIDYVLKSTKKEKLGLVAMSMGTTVFFAMASSLPEYNDKVLGFVALAPVAYIKEIHMSPRRRMIFSMLLALTRELTNRGDIFELMPRSSGLVNVARTFCTRVSPGIQDLCYDVAAVFMGYQSKLVLRSKLHLYTTHFPAGTSLKTFIHYTQNIRANGFRLFDYGTEKNLKLYGQTTPPDYPLWNITAPVALYYTRNDFYYDEKDIDDLRKLLQNVVEVDVKEKFNHVDFLWAYNAKETLYPKITALFRRLTDQYNIQTREKKSITTEKVPPCRLIFKKYN